MPVVAHEETTARKLAEQALRESDERFHLLADNITDAFWIRSPDLRELHYVSPAFERIWGRPVAVLYSNPGKWVDFIQPDDRARVLAAFAAFTADTAALDLEYRILRPDSEARWVHVRGFKARDAAGRPIRCVGVVTDVTEKRRAEQALRESDERMRLQTTALDAAANGVVITDHRGIIQWVNAAFTRLTGYSAAEAVGRTPRLLKSGQHSESAYRQMWQTISAGKVWHGEIINRRKDGRFYHEDMTITPVCDAAGETTHFIAVKQDITERKRAEASIQDLHKKLVVASREAGMADVAIDVLHNAGNALNSLNVSASVIADTLRHTKADQVAKLAALLRQHSSDLSEYLTLDPTGRKIPDFLNTLADALATERAAVIAELDQLQGHIQHVREIVARQQTIARAAVVLETVSVPDLVEDALRINVDALTGHDIELIRDFQARPVVTTDRHKATEILITVVLAAREACDRSGRADKQVTARITSEPGTVRIAVIDNGVGLSPEEVRRIFRQEFGPGAENSRSLHRAATAARELGGAITVRSDGPGCGAIFELELPAADGENNSRAVSVPTTL